MDFKWGTLKIYERLELQPTKIALFSVIFYIMFV